MKSRKWIANILLMMIFFLLGVTFCYASIMFKPNVELDAKKPAQSGQDEVLKHNGIPSGEVGIKTPLTMEEIKNLSSREYDTMFVIGKTSCGYCQRYYPVLKSVVEKYKIEIVYVDMEKLSSSDLKEFLNEFTIPSKCRGDGIEAKLFEGFGTPLTLFISKNETYDCIRAYNNEGRLVNQLKKIGYI